MVFIAEECGATGMSFTLMEMISIGADRMDYIADMNATAETALESIRPMAQDGMESTASQRMAPPLQMACPILRDNNRNHLMGRNS